MKDLDEAILGLLFDQRHAADEVAAEFGDEPDPRIGCAEWEVAKLCADPGHGVTGKSVLRRLTVLRKAGKVNRSGGFVWLTPEEYASRLRSRAERS